MVLAKVELARQALAEAKTIDEVWDIQQQANAALKVLKSQRDSSYEAQNYAAEIKVRAERKLGEMLQGMEKNEGTKGQLIGPGLIGSDALSPPKESPPPSYSDLGLDKKAASRWQAVASVPEERFEEYIENTKAAADEITSAAILRESRKIRREEARNRPTPKAPTGVFNVILADPPWQYDNQIESWGPASLHYPPMPTEDIKDLAANGYIPAADNATLFLWVTNPFLEEGLAVADAWGFEYKTNIVWVKRHLQRPGSGFYVRGRHELLFICTKGSHVPDQRGQEPIGSVLEASVDEHSRKPEAIHELIERMYPNSRYLELFARRARDGWVTWGDEVGPNIHE